MISSDVIDTLWDKYSDIPCYVLRFIQQVSLFLIVSRFELSFKSIIFHFAAFFGVFGSIIGCKTFSNKLYELKTNSKVCALLQICLMRATHKKIF